MKYFEEEMTYPEALKAFFILTDGKTPEEISLIQEEFQKIVSAIVDREIDGSPNLTSYKI